MTTATFIEAEQFFYANGSWNHDADSGETSEQGRVRCAREAARDESRLRELGWHVQWELDADAENEPGENWFVSGAPQWEAVLYDDAGSPLASLCGIDFGYWPGGDAVVPDDNPPYRRVVEAQLAGEALRGLA